MRRVAALGLTVLLAAAMAFAGDAEPVANLKFLVIKDVNEKPVRNASVILHPVGKDGKQSSGGTQLKTDPEGRASLDGVPFGKLRIQVIAHGFQTYGDDYEINKAQQEFTIRLKPPKEQYSIYK